MKSQSVHRWYTRPVFFVADVKRAIGFYVDKLGFQVGWHSGDGSGKVCQVNHGECEIILCEDAMRSDKSRLFIELTAEGLADLRREILERSVKWLDEQLPEVIGRWQFHPYSLNGKARPFCFTTKYSIDALED